MPNPVVRPRRGIRLVLAVALSTAVLSVQGTAQARERAQSEIAAAAIPEGAAVREDQSFAIYQFIGGAKIWIPNVEEFRALGYSPNKVIVVPKGRLAQVPVIPRGETLLRERDDPTVFVMIGGSRHGIDSPASFEQAGYRWPDVRVVAHSALSGIPRGVDVSRGLFAAAPGAEASAQASSAGRQCAGRLFKSATSRRDVHGNLIFGTGARTYSLQVISYLRECGGYVQARHQIYLDTRALPHGQKLTLIVSTKRSDGRWARAHSGLGYEFSARQRNHDEVILYQDRGVGGGLTVDEVNVKHCLCALGDGNFPISSTVKARYQPFNGPELSPRG